MLGTIIIPAHNEQHTISRCLEDIQSSEQQDFDIIVCCNGCTDDTFKIVRDNYPSVKCIELPQASKSAAINHAETYIRFTPTIYMDADISINNNSLQSLVSRLRSNPNTLVFPKVQLNFSECSRWVKAYYRFWQSTHYAQEHGFGSGIYMLDDAGRRRFIKFPELISDDGYVHSLFKESEIIIDDQAISHVRPPKTVFGLINTLSRTKLGDTQLADLYPQMHARKKGINPSWLALNFYTYVLISIISKIIAKYNFYTHNYNWNKDYSSRV